MDSIKTCGDVREQPGEALKALEGSRMANHDLGKPLHGDNASRKNRTLKLRAYKLSETAAVLR